MKKTENTRNQHLDATQGRKHDEEIHTAYGAICQWFIDGKIYEEHQPDIGKVTWYVYTE